MCILHLSVFRSEFNLKLINYTVTIVECKKKVRERERKENLKMQDECCLSRVEAACLAGAGRGLNGIDELRALSSNSNTTNSADPWYTVEQFERVSLFLKTKLQEKKFFKKKNCL